MNVLNWIKTYTKPITYTLFAILCIAALVYINNLRQEQKKLKEELTLIRLQKQGTIVKIEQRYTDTSGGNHIVIEKNVNPVSSQALKDGAINIGLIDSTSAVLKAAKDQITQITRVNFTISNKNIILQKTIDSLTKKEYYSYNGKYLKYTESDSGDTRIGNYTYNGDIHYVDYTKKKVPIIGRTFEYTDIYSTDTSFRIGTVQRLTIQHAPKIWSLKLKGGGLSRIDNFKPYAGAKLELGFKSFTLTGARYYNTSGTKIDLIGLDYTILSF